MVSRHATLALIAIVASAGCRAGGFNDGLGRPAPIAPKAAPAPEAAEYIERINANAGRVTSLMANPSITLGSLDGRGGGGSAHGELAVERPRNFRLKLVTPGMGLRDLADLGSNDQEFWFWSDRDNKDRALFVCEYDTSGDAALPTAMQPDWIVEAMGLRTIPPAEAAGATVKANAKGEAVLTVRRRGAQGESLSKETIFDAASGQVREHRLIKADRLKGTRVLLAKATIDRWQPVRPVAAPGEAAGAAVMLPQAINLVWYEQNLRMGVALREVKLNPTLSDDDRVELFTEPEKPRVTRKSFPGMAPLASGSSTRKSRSIPPSPSASRRAGEVELGEPIPIPAPGMVDGAKGAPADPRPLDADLPPLSHRARRSERFLGAAIPTAPVDFAEAGPPVDDGSAGFLR